MPVNWLTEIERDLLGKWPESVTDGDLATFFTFSEDELREIRDRRGDENRLGFAVGWCALRFLGFFPEDPRGIPESALRHLARQLNVEPAALSDYAQTPRTKSDHEQLIVERLGFRRVSETDRHELFNWVVERALEHDRPIVLLNSALDWLRVRKLLRPGLTLLERDVAAARTEADERVWGIVRPMLDAGLTDRLDGLLKTPTPYARSQLAWLRKEAVSASPDAINETLDRIDRLREIGVEKWDLRELNPNRIRRLAQFAGLAWNQRIERMPPKTRYPMLLALLSETYAAALDTAVDQFDRCLADIQHDAERDLDSLRVAAARTGSERNRLLGRIARVLLDGQVRDEEVRKSVFGVVPRDHLLKAVEECDVEQRPGNDWPADQIARRFGYLRRFTPRFLTSFKWKCSLEYASLARAIAAVVKMWGKGASRLPENAPRDFIPSKWMPWVFPNGNGPERKFYELCVLWELRTALRSGNLWVEGARRYTDPATFMISPDRWRIIGEQNRRALGIPAEAESQLHSLEENLASVARKLEKVLEVGTEVSLDEGGHLCLARLDPEEQPDGVDTLRELFDRRLPLVDLSELLIEVDFLTGFSSCFTHASNHHKTRKEDHPLLYAALLAQGGNFGVARIAQMTRLSEKAIREYSQWYLRKETIKDAYSLLSNHVHRHPLAGHWGDGTLSSSDGQRFRVRSESFTAVSQPKYFGWDKGLTCYTWTSDQFVQYATKVIPTTLRDATIVLDGILDNQTELPIKTHVTDTGGYTEITFALFSLLGLQFAPRISDMGSQRLYRIGTTPTGRVGGILKGKIKTDLIERHWDDLLRLAASLKTGWVTASLMVSRMQAASRKNPLVRALQEYGRIVKTNFVLTYLESKEVRRMVQKQLNKGEGNQGLRAFLFAGNEGHVRTGFAEDQLEQFSCLTLLVNAVKVWNTTYYDALLKQLKAEGHKVTDEHMKYIWPNRYGHINPFGVVSFPIQDMLKRKELRPFRK